MLSLPGSGSPFSKRTSLKRLTCWLTSIGCFGSSFLIAQPAFFRKDISVGDGPGPIIVGDFNGDGRPDLAVVSSSTLGILLDNGSGGFTTGSSYTVPSGQQAKAVAVGSTASYVCPSTSTAGA